MNDLITLSTNPTRSERLHESIRGLGEYGLVTPTSYVVQSDLTAASIIELLQKGLGPSDDIGVFAVGQPWATFCDLIVENFLVGAHGEFEDWTPRDYESEDNGDKLISRIESKRRPSLTVLSRSPNVCFASRSRHATWRGLF